MKKRFIKGIITCSLAGLSLSMTLSLNAFASASEDMSVNKIDSALIDSSPRNVINIGDVPISNTRKVSELPVSNSPFKSRAKTFIEPKSLIPTISWHGVWNHEYSDGNIKWVKVGDSFGFGLTSYIPRSTGLYPNYAQFDLRDGNQSILVSSDYNGSSIHRNPSAAFLENFNIDNIENEWHNATQWEWNSLNARFYVTAKQHGKSYRLWSRSARGPNFSSWQDSGATIKTDGLNPNVSFLNDQPYTWISASSYTLKTQVTDTDSGPGRFRYFMNGAQSTGDWKEGHLNMDLVVSTQGRTGVSIVGIDKVGNSKQTNTYVCLDNIKPTINVNINPNTWTSSNVNVNISASDNTNGGGINYILLPNGSRYNPSSGSFNANTSYNITSNGTYTFEVYDMAGNKASQTITISNIDRTAPSGNAWIENVSATGFDVVVNNLSDSQSGVNRVEICAWRDGWDVDGRWQTDYRSSGTSRFRVNTSDYSGKAGRYYVDVRVFDNVGNGGNPIGHVQTTVPYPNIYSSPLVISNHEYQNGNVYWVKSGDAFTAKAYGYTNPESSKYKINREFVLARADNSTNFNNFKSFAAAIPEWLGNWTNHSETWIANDTYSTSLRFGNGSYSVRTEGSWVDSYFNLILDGDENLKLSPLVRVEADGNVLDSDWNANSVIVKSDSQAPTIALSANPNKTWSNSNVTVSIGVSDSRSGVNRWTVRKKVNNGAWTNLNNNTTSVILNEDGTHVIEVTATDNVGHSRTQSITVKVDKTAPTIRLTPSNTNWSNQNVTITAEIADNLSGIVTKKWATGSRTKEYFASAGETLSGNSIIATANQTYTFYAKDAAGNETVQPITISKIDKKPPTISGDLDNGWTKENKVISFTATDDLSGVSSIKLWNEAKTSVLKTGTTNNGIGNLVHTITTEGITKYKIEATDNASNTATNNVTVRIDKTSPTATVTTPSISDKRTIEISLNNLVDNHSGVKEVWVSEKSDFSSGVTKQSLTGLTTKKFNFIFDKKTSKGEHFTNRNVYIRVYDNVGNYTNYTKTVKLIPAKPKTPVIETPVENDLYLKGENVILKWSYSSEDPDFGKLPQLLAEVELKHKNAGGNGQDKIYKYSINGEIFEMKLKDLEFGDYEVKVKVYNHLDPDVYAESAVRKFRYNKFKDNGNVITVKIETESPIRFVSVLTENEIPAGTKIEGYVYYAKDKEGNADKSQLKKVTLTKEHSQNNIIELPVRTNTIWVEYKLIGSKDNKYISPVLDGVKVLAK